MISTSYKIVLFFTDFFNKMNYEFINSLLLCYLGEKFREIAQKVFKNQNLKTASTTSSITPRKILCFSSFPLALRLRMMKKMILGPFSKFYMFRAKFYCIKEDDIDCNLEWLLTKKGQSFLFGDSSTKNNWTFGQKTSNMVGEVRGDFSMDPLAHVSNYYR